MYTAAVTGYRRRSIVRLYGTLRPARESRRVITLQQTALRGSARVCRFCVAWEDEEVQTVLRGARCTAVAHRIQHRGRVARPSRSLAAGVVRTHAVSRRSSHVGGVAFWGGRAGCAVPGPYTEGVLTSASTSSSAESTPDSPADKAGRTSLLQRRRALHIALLWVNPARPSPRCA